LKGKLTLPILLLLERSPAKAREGLQESLKKWVPDYFPALKVQLEEHQVLVESVRVVQTYLATARKELKMLSEGEGRSHLEQLTEYLEQQMALIGKSA
jgi:geranylgeranyl pyrophosphate synthase